LIPTSVADAGHYSAELPKFSLVLVTLGRTSELERFLVHLQAQEYSHLELIVVDQNIDQRLIPLLDKFDAHFPIVRLRSPRGLSRGRNIGLQHATGQFVGFPDDDCWYPPKTLGEIARIMSANPEWAGLTGRPVTDSQGSGYKWFDRTSGVVDKHTVWRRSTSYTIFLRAAVVRSVGYFDESLGVGSESGRIAAEEVDYLIRAIERNFRIVYDSDLWVYHLEPSSVYDKSLIARGYGYSLGLGHVLRKHHYPLRFVIYMCLRALGAALFSFLVCDFARAHYHYSVLKGRVLGWIG
jgi:glycosyltransferase involved in cell wall biosynthesis